MSLGETTLTFREDAPYLKRLYVKCGNKTNLVSAMTHSDLFVSTAVAKLALVTFKTFVFI